MKRKSDIGILLFVLLVGGIYLYEPAAEIIDSVLRYAVPVVIYGVIVCTEKGWIPPGGSGSNMAFIFTAGMYSIWLVMYLTTDHDPPRSSGDNVLMVISLVGVIILAGYLRGKCWLRS
ncbi:hypothetical protein HED60_14590 [Planctomycetales bacterium ZRK34]|nr:hypothetical protein HED60_14590 [Planctomycetales bacterium ZRK34]